MLINILLENNAPPLTAYKFKIFMKKKKLLTKPNGGTRVNIYHTFKVCHFC